MERADEELKHLGLFGIIKESFKLIFSCKKLFTKITVALILPFSFIYLFHLVFTTLLFGKTIAKFTADDYLDVELSDLALFWTFQAACTVIYIILALLSASAVVYTIACSVIYIILALLSASAVVYTIACIYTNKEPGFKKVMGAVPKVWKRLLVTCMWSVFLLFIYIFIAIVTLHSIVVLTGLNSVAIVFVIIQLVFDLVCIVYICVIWSLASVVSVLEEIRGLEALKKSRTLIKGKLCVVGAIFFVFVVLYSGIMLLFEVYAVSGISGGWGVRILVGIACLVMLSKLILFSLVSQTVIYFVCKSYQHEIIDKSSLAYHLEVNLGDYVPLRDNNIQIQQVHP